MACVDILKNTEKIFTDMQVEVLDMIEEDNKVTIPVQFTGTHSGEIYDVKPTGKRISSEAI